MLEQIKQSLINYYPSGSAWIAKSNIESNLNKRIGATAIEFNRQLETIAKLKKELNLLETEQLISEFEKEYGIPDDCFSTNVSLQQRINQVNIKQLMNGADFAEDWENIASLLGINAIVTNGIDAITFPLVFPIPMIATEAEARFTIVVTFPDDNSNPVFPLTFPITFGSGEDLEKIKCIFDKLKPADTQIVYLYKEDFV